MKVQEFMTTKIEFIDANRSVYDAIERMVDRRIRSLVVKFPEKDTDYGVITARDVVFKALAEQMNPSGTKVSKIASRPIVCIDKNMDLADAATLMEQSNIARLFVCEGEKIIGVVSLLDVMAGALIMRARGDHVS